MKKCIIFNGKGNFARFRKPYTTTSALTYLCMHPIAIKGMLGAILGVDKEEVCTYFNEIKIGIQVLHEVRKDMGSFNLISMRSGELFRFPSNVEFLRDVHYRFFIQAEEALLEQLKEVLITHQYVFMPYFGASEHIAKLTFEALETVEGTEEQATTCVVPIAQCDINQCILEKVYTDKLPIAQNEKREYTQYEQVIIPVLGEKVMLREKVLCKVGEYDVYFF